MAELDREGLAERLARVPLHAHLGFRLGDVHDDGITVECQLRPEYGNTNGVTHGGLTAALVDTAVGMSIAWHFRGQRTASTIELKLNYLRPLTGEFARARCHLLRVGKQVVVARIDVRDDEERLAASGMATYMIIEAQSIV